ncbi:MAG: metallophosphoesterase [Pseudobdellovibrionaceae bacterium]|nr:metallophosphoesterase [Pseudobdellovibrionaceae bacterium]
MKTASFLLSCALLTACGERYSPWESDPPSHLKNLTAEQLSALNEMPEQSFPFTVAVMGDPQGTPKDLQRVVDSINRRTDVKFILVLGDLTDYGLLHEYVWAGEALKRSRVPFLTVVGNHDAIAHGKQIYSQMFGAFDYTFDYAGVKFVMWNNNQFEFGETDFSWLERVTDSRSVVNSHVPPVVDVHTQPQIDRWLDVNRRADIIASLHGHRGTQIDYGWQEDGIPYYIVPKLSGRRYSLVTFHEDRSVSFQYCRDDCGDLQ